MVPRRGGRGALGLAIPHSSVLHVLSSSATNNILQAPCETRAWPEAYINLSPQFITEQVIGLLFLYSTLRALT